MGFWRNLLGIPEKRAVTTVPWDTVPFNVGPSVYEGPAVTQQRALSLAPVYSAVDLIAQNVATFPLNAYRKVGDQRVPMSSLPQLFDQLRLDGQLRPWLFRAITSLALRGNAFGYVVACDGFGFPTVLDWLNPSRVAPDDRPRKTGWLVDGREVDRSSIVHIPWFCLPGERLGLSPIGAFANTIGVGLGAQSYAEDWFNAGGFPPGKFKNTEQTVNQTQAAEIKARLAAAIRSREPLVYGRDWDYSAISVPPEEAQFVQTMKLAASTIASIYHVPPEKIGGESGNSLTYATREQNAMDLSVLTFRPWTEALEDVFSAILPDRQYVKFNMDALVRPDLKTRWESYEIQLRTGVRNVDEIRALEDLEPLPNGQGATYGPAQIAAGSQQAPTDEPASTPLRRIA